MQNSRTFNLVGAAALLGLLAAVLSFSPAASAAKTKGTITVAVNAGFTYEALPDLLVASHLKREGITVKFTQLQSPIEVAAVTASGSADMGVDGTFAELLAIKQGAKLKLLGFDRPNSWLLVGTKGSTCQSLNGKKLGGTAPDTAGADIAQAWFKRCGSSPTFVSIPGSTTREVAMENGQLTTTYLPLATWLVLKADKPGQFTILARYQKFAPNELAQAVFANSSWLNKHTALATAYVSQLKNVFAAINHNGKAALTSVAKRYLSSSEFKTLSKDITAYRTALGRLPAKNLGFTRASVSKVISTAHSIGLLTATTKITVSQLADFGPVKH